MVEFRTTVKPAQKEEILALMTSALNQVVETIDISIEDSARIVLIKVRFNTMSDAERFIALIREHQLPLNRWILHEHQQPRISSQTE